MFLLNSFLSLLYPPLCLHCEMPLDQTENFFCQSCLYTLDLIAPLNRCLLCFSETQKKQVCESCRKKKTPFHRKGAVFEPVGAAFTLLSNLSLRNQPYLAKGAAGFLAAQWIRFKWPKPDLIIPSPIPLIQKMKLGYDPHDLLTLHLGKILNVPKKPLLLSRMDDQITLKKDARVSDQTILLIGGILDKRMEDSGNQLAKGFPHQIYGLSLCMRP